MSLTEQQVRDFVIEALDEPLRTAGIEPAQVGDDFDLLESGVIDSLGLLELIPQVEDRFGIEIDFEEMDPENMTIVGPFSRFVTAQAQAA